LNKAYDSELTQVVLESSIAIASVADAVLGSKVGAFMDGLKDSADVIRSLNVGEVTTLGQAARVMKLMPVPGVADVVDSLGSIRGLAGFWGDGDNKACYRTNWHPEFEKK